MSVILYASEDFSHLAAAFVHVAKYPLSESLAIAEQVAASNARAYGARYAEDVPEHFSADELERDALRLLAEPLKIRDARPLRALYNCSEDPERETADVARALFDADSVAEACDQWRTSGADAPAEHYQAWNISKRNACIADAPKWEDETRKTAQLSIGQVVETRRGFGSIVAIDGSQDPSAGGSFGGVCIVVGGASLAIVYDDGSRVVEPESVIRSDSQTSVYHCVLSPHDVANLEALAKTRKEYDEIKTEREERKRKAQAAADTETRAALPAQFPHLETMATTKKTPWALAAANIRRELKRAFPGVRFSVRSDSGGHCTVHISWTDGPTSDEVDEVAQRYSSGGFDSMTDYAYSVDNLFGDVFGDVWAVYTRREVSDEFSEAAQRGICDLQSIEYDGPETNAFGADDYDYNSTVKNRAAESLSECSLLPGETVTGASREKHEKARACWSAVVRDVDGNEAPRSLQSPYPGLAACLPGYVAPDAERAPKKAAKPSAAKTDETPGAGFSADAVDGVSYELNEAKNGVEITFPGKPSAAIRSELKATGFRWSGRQKLWYAKQTAERVALAERLSGATAEPSTEPVNSEPTESADVETAATLPAIAEPAPAGHSVGSRVWWAGFEVEIQSEPRQIHGGWFQSAWCEERKRVVDLPAPEDVAERVEKTRETWNEQQAQFARLHDSPSTTPGAGFSADAEPQTADVDDSGADVPVDDSPRVATVRVIEPNETNETNETQDTSEPSTSKPAASEDAPSKPAPLLLFNDDDDETEADDSEPSASEDDNAGPGVVFESSGPVTLFYVSDFMGTVQRVQCRSLTIERKPYAQHPVAFFCSFVPKGKRKARQIVRRLSGCYLLVLPGHDAPDVGGFDWQSRGSNTTDAGTAEVMQAKYSSFDPRYVSDFIDRITSYCVNTNTRAAWSQVDERHYAEELCAVE